MDVQSLSVKCASALDVVGGFGVKGGWKKVMFMLVLRKVAAVVVWSV
jgi:hypothetical protein